MNDISEVNIISNDGLLPLPSVYNKSLVREVLVILVPGEGRVEGTGRVT